jgi:hypothetical protein
MRLTRAFLIGLIAVCLSACSPGQKDLFRSSNEQRIYQDGPLVKVTNVEDEAAARPLAEQYCNGLGRAAHFERMELLSYHHVATKSAAFSCG